jgi:hypothetical protein
VATRRSHLEAGGRQSIESRPIVTARFAAIDGVPVSQLVEQRRREDPTSRTATATAGSAARAAGR